MRGSLYRRPCVPREGRPVDLLAPMLLLAQLAHPQKSCDQSKERGGAAGGEARDFVHFACACRGARGWKRKRDPNETGPEHQARARRQGIQNPDRDPRNFAPRRVRTDVGALVLADGRRKKRV